jgi:hypothetical protein
MVMKCILISLYLQMNHQFDEGWKFPLEIALIRQEMMEIYLLEVI